MEEFSLHKVKIPSAILAAKKLNQVGSLKSGQSTVLPLRSSLAEGKDNHGVVEDHDAEVDTLCYKEIFKQRFHSQITLHNSFRASKVKCS